MNECDGKQESTDSKGLYIKPAEECRFDLFVLAEVMLRFDPSYCGIASARNVRVWAGDGEYDVVLGLGLTDLLYLLNYSCFRNSSLPRSLSDARVISYCRRCGSLIYFLDTGRFTLEGQLGGNVALTLLPNASHGFDSPKRDTRIENSPATSRTISAKEWLRSSVPMKICSLLNSIFIYGGTLVYSDMRPRLLLSSLSGPRRHRDFRPDKVLTLWRHPRQLRQQGLLAPQPYGFQRDLGWRSRRRHG